jgi:hypothetical protein
LEKNIEKVSWAYLSHNPKAIHLLEANQDKIHWRWLSENPNAIHLIEQNLDKVDWNYLSKNPNPKAIHLLEKNQDKIEWYSISTNPAIFEPVYDYHKMKERMRTTIAEELLQKAMHPSRLKRYLDMGGDLENF